RRELPLARRLKIAGRTKTITGWKQTSTLLLFSYILLLEEIQCSPRQDLDPDGHCILIYIETWMVMWVLRTLCLVLCSYNKVAPVTLPRPVAPSRIRRNISSRCSTL